MLPKQVSENYSKAESQSKDEAHFVCFSLLRDCRTMSIVQHLKIVAVCMLSSVKILYSKMRNTVPAIHHCLVISLLCHDYIFALKFTFYFVKICDLKNTETNSIIAIDKLLPVLL